MCTGLDNICPISTANAIASAFQTQGLYVQADIIQYLNNTSFGLWAPLLYVVSVASGLIMMAMGQPPRTYIWYMLGPGIFNWCLFTTMPVRGVAWNVAGEQQNQSIVWKLAEVGLLNTNLVQNGNIPQNKQNSINLFHEGHPTGAVGKINVNKTTGPNTDVHVSKLYLEFDALVSETTRNLASWTGIYNMKTNSAGDTNTPQLPANGGGGINASAGSKSNDHAWHILSTSKWPMLENITSASLHNQDLREAFVTFMSSECGDIMARHVDEAAYINAAYSKGKNLPNSVFNVNPLTSIPLPTGLWGSIIVPLPGDFNMFKSDMITKVIPAPRPLVESLKKSGAEVRHQGTFQDFIKTAHRDGASFITNIINKGNINCHAYFWTIVQGFRWEAGHAYNQVVREGLEYGVTEEQVNYAFTYGWSFEGKGGQQSSSNSLSPDEQKRFIQDLILLHIVRNELAFVQNPVNERWSPSERSVDYTMAYQRNIGSKNKFGELYTWAKMMPYVQGVLLYILTMAYPLVCVVMIIPGWWKTMLSWMAFLAWAKSWDVGFAIVITLERAIWGMLGNSADSASINGKILNLQKLGTLDVTCPGSANQGFGCTVPTVASVDQQSWYNAAKTFDFAFLMSGNLDLDKANSYYIYLMSALYFAVPAVAGQVLLGAKAGASSLATNLLGQNPQTIGNAAGSAASGDVATRGNNAVSIAEQTAQAKSMRSGKGADLMRQAIGAQNAALEMGAERDLLGAEQQRRNDAMTIAERNLGNRRNAAAAATAFMGIPLSAAEAAERGGQAGSGGGPGGQGPGVAPIRALGAATAAGASAANNYTGQAAEWRAFGQFSDFAARQTRANVALGNAAAELGMRQQAESSMGQRMSQAANQQVGEDSWRAKRDFAHQLTGRSTALGVFAGQYSAGPKPQNSEGMAGLGMLGEGLNNLFDYPVSGYNKQVDSGMGRLNSMFSPDSHMYQNRPSDRNQGMSDKLLGGLDFGQPSGVTKAGSLADQGQLPQSAIRAVEGAALGNVASSIAGRGWVANTLGIGIGTSVGGGMGMFFPGMDNQLKQAYGATQQPTQPTTQPTSNSTHQPATNPTNIDLVPDLNETPQSNYWEQTRLDRDS